MKKLITAISLIIVATAMVGCGHVTENDSTKDLSVTPVSEIRTESVDIQASTNSDGEVILDDKDENVTIETTTDGEQIATIKNDDGSEVKVAVTTDDEGNKVIDTTKVVTDDGTVKKADDDSKTEVKVDDNGNVTVSTTSVDDTSSYTPVITSTYDPTVNKPETYVITTTYDPNVTPKSTTTSKTTTKETTTTPKTTTSPKVTTTPKTTTVTTTTSPKSTTTTTTTTKPKTTTTKTTTTAPTTTTKTTTTTAHVHNWVDVTETRTIHHDAEYAKRRYWLYGDLAQDGMPLSWVTIPSNSTHLESYDGFRPTQYQLLMTWYGSWDNIPSKYVTEWITKDNCADYGLTYNTMANYANPYTTSPEGKYIGKFNPEYDVIVCISIDAFGDACDGIANGRAYDWHDISECYGDLDDFYLPVAEDTICVKDAWDETTTVVVGHKCTSCGATK